MKIDLEEWLAAAVGTAALLMACPTAPPADEARIDASGSSIGPPGAEPVPATRREDAVDPVLADRHPSLEFYPGVDASLRAALQDGAGPRAVLAAFASSMAPHRWPSMYDWDRHGFIELAGPVRGFVTRVSGGLVPQPGDRRDLGCAGGFLEGVRLTLLPHLAVDDLDRCDDTAEAVTGAPERCDPEHDYGWLALANIARRLSDDQLPAGRRLIAIDVHQGESLAPLAAPGAMHLCTVSHISAVYGHARYHHHMMIVLGTPDEAALDVFDTTGGRGVSLKRMPRERFTRYCAVQLRDNREYRYVGRSTGLTCLPVVVR